MCIRSVQWTGAAEDWVDADPGLSMRRQAQAMRRLEQHGGLWQQCRATERLSLKEGAQVMLVCNLDLTSVRPSVAARRSKIRD
eukprot:SAG31_NODE_150_length_22290_cov_5.975801_17_plen_83_part_00